MCEAMSDEQLLALSKIEDACTLRLVKSTMLGVEVEDNSDASSQLSELDEAAYQEALKTDDKVSKAGIL